MEIGKPVIDVPAGKLWRILTIRKVTRNHAGSRSLLAERSLVAKEFVRNDFPKTEHWGGTPTALRGRVVRKPRPLKAVGVPPRKSGVPVDNGMSGSKSEPIPKWEAC